MEDSTNDFVKKAANMRRLQSEYFRTRDNMTLRTAKKLESEVDKCLQSMAIPPQGTQTQLFN